MGKLRHREGRGWFSLLTTWPPRGRLAWERQDADRGVTVSVAPRLTTQWSVEDEEEAARERRRRERDRQLRAQDEDGDGQSPEQPEQEKL